MEIAQLAVDRRDDRLREQLPGDDPREVLQSAQVADDRRQRGRDDGGIERGQEQRQQEAAERDEHAAT
jgi:hypothetical protein